MQPSHDGSRRSVALRLGIGRSTLHRWCRERRQ
ncbi:hypothetical protein [Bradyrhizobium sp. CCBAU 11434]